MKRINVTSYEKNGKAYAEVLEVSKDASLLDIRAKMVEYLTWFPECMYLTYNEDGEYPAYLAVLQMGLTLRPLGLKE